MPNQRLAYIQLEEIAQYFRTEAEKTIFHFYRAIQRGRGTYSKVLDNYPLTFYKVAPVLPEICIGQVEGHGFQVLDVLPA